MGASYPCPTPMKIADRGTPPRPSYNRPPNYDPELPRPQRLRRPPLRRAAAEGECRPFTERTRPSNERTRPPQRKDPAPHACCVNRRRAAVKASPDPPPARWCAVKQPSCRGGTPLSRGNTQHRPPPTEGCAAKGECRNAEGELPRPAVGRAKRPA